ncbi:hypothetical protein G4Y79_08975 [Phototrophicus methaneseepsis]|uniref:Uncharacterized protein n=1 Tax=Phototrophicus methaneseepsis TaxID=2710758 RepID=A0A7S8ECL8_9CHLR|nr:hypothetical protein [Phototrophicus methaneseepsis]QPC84490.1 hypothetical protein G4Y79_08975 [Phototrophicus methaneseepsis]
MFPNPLNHLDMHRANTEEHERRAEHLRLLHNYNDTRRGKRARKGRSPQI